MKKADRHQTHASNWIMCDTHRQRYFKFDGCNLCAPDLCQKCRKEPVYTEGLCYPCHYYRTM